MCLWVSVVKNCGIHLAENLPAWHTERGRYLVFTCPKYSKIHSRCNNLHIADTDRKDKPMATPNDVRITYEEGPENHCPRCDLSVKAEWRELRSPDWHTRVVQVGHDAYAPLEFFPRLKRYVEGRGLLGTDEEKLEAASVAKRFARDIRDGNAHDY